MEELNKTQIILLTLFITFVTSVTTGIVTVTLLEQSPPAVTQTINRVVEKTIEKVTPGKTEIRETKVLLTQEEEIVKAVSLVKPAVVRLTLSLGVSSFIDDQKSDQGTISNGGSAPELAAVSSTDSANKKELSTGFVISSDGLFVVPYQAIPDPNIIYAAFIQDKEYKASVIIQDRNLGIAVLKINKENGGELKLTAAPLSSKKVLLGQTVIVLGRNLERFTASVGIVSDVLDASPSSPAAFKTNVKSDDTNIGGPVLNSEGMVIGMNLQSGNSISSDLIKIYLAENIATSTRQDSDNR